MWLSLLLVFLFSPKGHAGMKAWQGTPPEIMVAVEMVESGGVWSAVSSAGCVGVMQICPQWATFKPPLLYLPAINRMEGAKHLSYWRKRAKGNWETALAAYNCGNHGLRGVCGRAYAKKVLRLAAKLRKGTNGSETPVAGASRGRAAGRM